MTEKSTPPPPTAACAPPPQSAIRRSEAMRWALLVGLFGLATLCAFIGFTAGGESLATAVVMGGSGIGLLLLGRALFLTDASIVSFDGARLADDSGRVLCTLEEIAQVERGFALFKPSSGFVLTLKAPRERGWSPGLWWRYGRRIGVGGATPSRAGRHMADTITLALSMRNAG
ncbi:MAG: hypothetical protein WD969_01215 [Paracoccaceae bacterium]